MTTRDLELVSVVESANSPTEEKQGIPQTFKRKTKERQDSLWKGVCFQLMSSLMAVATFTFVKISNTTNHIPNPQIILISSCVTFSMAAIIAFVNKVDLSDGLNYKKLLMLRSLSGMVNISVTPTAIQYLNLSVATTLMNTGPIIGVIFGVLFLKERFSATQGLAAVVSFFGVVLIAMPCLLFLMACDGDQAWNAYLILPLVSGFSRAFTRVMVRSCKTIHWVMPVLVAAAPMIPVSLLFMLVSGMYTSLSFEAFFTVSLSGCVGTTGHIFMVKATLVAEIGFSMPLSYLSVVLCFLVDALYFNSPVGKTHIIGAAVIFAGLVLLTWAKYSQKKTPSVYQKEPLREEATLAAGK